MPSPVEGLLCGGVGGAGGVLQPRGPLRDLAVAKIIKLKPLADAFQ